MRGQRSERIMPVVQPRAGRIDRNSELRVLIAALLQLAPIAGGKQYAISVENVSAPNLARQGVEPRVALRPFHSVVFKNLGLPRQEILIMRHLIIGRES